MDYFKVKVKHVLSSKYMNDRQFRAWVTSMAVASLHEEAVNDDVYRQHIGPKSLQSMKEVMTKWGTSHDKVILKLLEDVEQVKTKRSQSKKRAQVYRDKNKKVTHDEKSHHVTEKRREEEIKEKKIKEDDKNAIITSDDPQSVFLSSIKLKFKNVIMMDGEWLILRERYFEVDFEKRAQRLNDWLELGNECKTSHYQKIMNWLVEDKVERMG